MTTTAATAELRARRPALRRRVDRRIGAGVIGGVADWLSAPTVFLRVVFLAATSVWPGLWVAYALAGLVLPARGRSRPDWDNLVGLARLGLFLAFTFGWPGSIEFGEWSELSPGLWVSELVLSSVALALFLGRNYPRGPSAADARAAVRGALPALALVGVLAAGMELAPDLRWERAVPTAAIVVCLVLLGGVRAGRWRFLLAPAALAVVASALVIGSDARLQGGIGDRTVRVVGARAAPISERLAVGDLTVNLGRLRQTRGSTTVRASVGLGTLRIIVPLHAHVALDARVGRGELDAEHPRDGFDQTDEGGYDLEVHDPNADVAGGRDPRGRRRVRVHVIADVGMGKLEVTGAF